MSNSVESDFENKNKAPTYVHLETFGLQLKATVSIKVVRAYFLVPKLT